jgi:delta 1-pyrroline-5-carboxylate dehydrogenase
MLRPRVRSAFAGVASSVIARSAQRVPPRAVNASVAVRHSSSFEAAWAKLLVVIGDKEYHADAAQEVQTVTSPSNHAHVLATFAETTPAQDTAAIESALAATAQWENLPFASKAAILLSSHARNAQ